MDKLYTSIGFPLTGVSNSLDFVDIKSVENIIKLWVESIEECHYLHWSAGTG